MKTEGLAMIARGVAKALDLTDERLDKPVKNRK
jgi:hypothetical protein